MKRAELVKLLELVQPALSDNNLAMIFTCFMFRPKNISAFNGTIGIVAKGGIAGEPFAVSGKILVELLKNSHADEVDFQIKDGNLIVKASKSTAKLPYFKEDEFLVEEPTGKWASSMKLDVEFMKGIETCLTTVSRDFTQPGFMGVCLNLDKPKLALFSCDGDAVTQYLMDKPWKGSGTYMLPNVFCDALLKITSATETWAGELKINDDWAVATLDNGFVIYGRMIENSNPTDHTQLIEQSLDKKQPFANLPLGLKEALSRARVLSDIENSKTIMTVFDNKLSLFTATHMGDIRDDLKIKHPDAEAFVDASMVQRSLAVCDEIAISDRVTAYRQGDTILQIVSNIGM